MTREARLEVRRLVRARPERVFAAWTSSEQLKQWWGPAGGTCGRAEVDLRPGGRYRIENLFPDGRTIWIVGEFEAVTPPHEVVYTWRVEPGGGPRERVTVRFEQRGDGTEVVVVHEQIPDEPTRARHEQGWIGCLSGLAEYLGRAS